MNARPEPGSMPLRVAIGVLLLVVGLYPTYQVSSWPYVNTPTLLGVLLVAGILGIVAGTSRVRSEVVRLLALQATLVLVWPPTKHLLAVFLPAGLLSISGGAWSAQVPGCAACSDLLKAMAAPGGWLVTASVVAVIAALPLSFWRRPPGRDDAGKPILLGRLIPLASALCVVGGPIGGLFAWLGLSNGDVYGSAFMIGILVALFGVLLYTGYSAFYSLVARTAPAAGLAAAYALVVVVLPLTHFRFFALAATY